MSRAGLKAQVISQRLRNRYLPLIVGIFFVFFTFWVLPGYRPFSGDLVWHYLPELVYKAHPQCYTHDILFKISQLDFTLFDEFITLLKRLTGLDYMSISIYLHLFFRLLFYLIIYHLTFYITKDRKFALLFPFFFSIPMEIYGYNFIRIVDPYGFPPRQYAIILSLASFTLFLYGHEIIAILLLYLALMFHIGMPLSFMFAYLFYNKRTFLFTVIGGIIFLLSMKLFQSPIHSSLGMEHILSKFKLMDNVWWEIIKIGSPNFLFTMWRKQFKIPAIALILTSLFVSFKILKERRLKILVLTTSALIVIGIFAELWFRMAFIIQLQFPRLLWVLKILFPLMLYRYWKEEFFEDPFYLYFTPIPYLTALLTPRIGDLILVSFFLITYLWKRTGRSIFLLGGISLTLFLVYYASLGYPYLLPFILLLLSLWIGLKKFFNLKFSTFIFGILFSLTVFRIINFDSYFKTLANLRINVVRPKSYEYALDLADWLKARMKCDETVLPLNFDSNLGAFLRMYTYHSLYLSASDRGRIIFDRDYAIEWLKREWVLREFIYHFKLNTRVFKNKLPSFFVVPGFETPLNYIVIKGQYFPLGPQTTIALQLSKKYIVILHRIWVNPKYSVWKVQTTF